VGGAVLAKHAEHFANCVFSGNTAVFSGGAVYVAPTVATSPDMVNCTVVGNHADGQGGGLAVVSGGLKLRNCILGQNTDGSASTGPQDEQFILLSGSATADIGFTTMQGWNGSLGGAGNNGNNPGLSDPNGPDNTFGTQDDDPTLTANSTAIDSGANPEYTGLLWSSPVDAAGNPRRRNDPNTPDSGIGPGDRIDRGAYEFQGASCGSADFNQDGDVGTDLDIESYFRCLAGNCCAQCMSADFNGDGDVGTDADIEAFFRVLSGGTC
jgi:predicted outer membrane repeat protein